MQRVLKPGGMAMIVFSHRSFIEKAPNSARFYKIKQTLLHFLQNLDLNQSKLCWLWNILEKTATVTNEAVRLWAAEPDDGEGHAHAVCQGASGPFPRPDPDRTTWPHPMIQWSSLIYRWFRTVSPGFTVVLVQLFSFRVQFIYNIYTPYIPVWISLFAANLSRNLPQVATSNMAQRRAGRSWTLWPFGASWSWWKV